MSLPTDIQPLSAAVYLLPVTTRTPLKFGREAVSRIQCARVCLRVRNRAGREAEGWGETPLSVTWVWPGALTFEERERALLAFTDDLAKRWAAFGRMGDVFEVGHAFQKGPLAEAWRAFNATTTLAEPMPWLAALVCCSAFDLALHDAFGVAAGRPVYELYGPDYLNRDLAAYLEPAAGADVSFAGRYPRDFLAQAPATRLPVWHLVGGLDAVRPEELTGREPADGHPHVLGDWIRRDGLKCLKFKLRGDDFEWDYRRTVEIGRVALEHGVDWLTADFNCTARDVAYVVAFLDRLMGEHPRIYGALLYVEQPFPYDLEAHPLDVHAIGARKPLFMDESAHDWEHVRRGRELGWTSVALKTCKTQTGALLAACWAKAHGMTLMVQDLTNPMLAMLPHAQLAAHVGTIMGVESNASQFYPAASEPEAAVHPGLFHRQDGHLSLESVRGPGFGYRIEEIGRPLPPARVDYQGDPLRAASPAA